MCVLLSGEVEHGPSFLDPVDDSGGWGGRPRLPSLSDSSRKFCSASAV